MKFNPACWDINHFLCVNKNRRRDRPILSVVSNSDPSRSESMSLVFRLLQSVVSSTCWNQSDRIKDFNTYLGTCLPVAGRGIDVRVRETDVLRIDWEGFSKSRYSM